MESVTQHSRRMIKKGSRSFSAAAALFDPAMRTDVEMLYAWCRHCDDVIDGQVLGFRQTHSNQQAEQPLSEKLEALRAKTIAAHAGEPQDDPVFAAFQSVVRKHDMPLEYPLDLLKGFEMDVASREYQTLNDTLEYCYHVAGVVGVMMAYIMGVRDEPTLQRACDLGLAFQLTNIARDIVEDAQNERVYIPLEWIREAQFPPNELKAPQNRDGVYALATRLLENAEQYYHSASYGVAELGFRSAWAISAASDVYRAIGVMLLEQGPVAWDARTSTSGLRKLQAVAYGFYRACSLKLVKPSASDHPRHNLWTKQNLSLA